MQIATLSVIFGKKLN